MIMIKRDKYVKNWDYCKACISDEKLSVWTQNSESWTKTTRMRYTDAHYNILSIYKYHNALNALHAFKLLWGIIHGIKSHSVIMVKLIDYACDHNTVYHIYIPKYRYI